MTQLLEASENRLLEVHEWARITANKPGVFSSMVRETRIAESSKKPSKTTKQIIKYLE